MWQLIITVLIVVTAFIIILYKVIRYFTNPLRKCDGCEKSCTGCPLEGLKKDH